MKHQLRVVTKRAEGHRELQTKLQRLLDDKWQIDNIMHQAYNRFVIVATKKVRMREPA